MTDELFTGLHCVAVPVRDQDRSKALFESMGFTTTMDANLQPGFRWIELTPSSGGPSLALVATGDQLPTGIDTGIRLITSDARATQTALAAKGLEVGDILAGKRPHSCSVSGTSTAIASTSASPADSRSDRILNPMQQR